jgi:hypothetical protein
VFIKGINVSNSRYLKGPEKIISKGKIWGTHLITEVVLPTFLFHISKMANERQI